MNLLSKIFKIGDCCCDKEKGVEEKKNSSCSCESCNTIEGIEIKVLGVGCKKCKVLEENTKEAVKELEISAKIEHITDFQEITKYGVISTPALLVNEKIVSYGKVLSKDEIKIRLQELLG